MADPSYQKTGDTWPPLRGKAEDDDGLAPLGDAESLRAIMVSGVTVIEGPAEAIDPPDGDGYNWQYVWGTADTNAPGTYNVELEVTWDSGSTPPKVGTYPKRGYETLIISADLD